MDPEPHKFATLGKGNLSSIFRSPNGQIIALVDGENFRWYDAETFAEMGFVTLGDIYASRVYFSPDSRLAAVEGFNKIKVVDLSAQLIVATISYADGVTTPVFSLDSQQIAYVELGRTTGGPYHTVALWDFSDNQLGGRFSVLFEFRYHVVTAPAISPDGKLVAAGYTDSTNKLLYIYDLYTKEVKSALEQASRVTSVSFSPDGGLLASGGLDGLVKLWDPRTGRLVQVINGLQNDVLKVDYSPDGAELTIYVREQPPQIWEVASGVLRPAHTPEPTPDPFAVMMHNQGYLEGGRGSSNPVLFSPDGQTLAVAGKNVLLWETATQQLLVSLENPGVGSIRGMAFSPVGTYFAGASTDGNIFVWELEDGRLLHTFESEQGTGFGPGIGAGVLGRQGVAFSPDGMQLAFGKGKLVELWEIQSGTRLKVLKVDHPEMVASSVTFSKDGQRLYLILNRNRAGQVWDLTTGQLIHEIAFTPVAPNAFSAIAQHGQYLARNNYDETGHHWIELWDLDTGQFLQLDTRGRDTEPLVFSPDGSLVAAISEGLLHVWKTETGQLVYVTRQSFGLSGLAISPDHQYLAVGQEGVAELWDISQIAVLSKNNTFTPLIPPTATPWLDFPTATPYPTRAITPLPLPTPAEGAITSDNVSGIQELARFGKGVIEHVTWARDGQTLGVVSSSGISLYSSDTFSETSTYMPGARMTDMVFLQDGRTLAAGVTDQSVEVWEVAEDEKLLELPGMGQPAVSPNGKLLVYADEEGALQIWDLEAEQPLSSLLSYAYYAYDPIFSPDSLLVAAMRTDNSVRVWDVITGEIVNALGGPDHEIADLSFSPDARFLIGAAGGSAWVWDMRPGVAAREFNFYDKEIDGNLTLYKEKVTAVALNHNNQTLAIGTTQRDIWLYERATGAALRNLEGHAGVISKLFFSPDGKRLLSVDQDGVIFIWEVASGKRLAEFHEYSGPLNGLEFGTDKNLFVLGSNTSRKIDPQNGNVVASTSIYTGTILAMSPDGDNLAVYNPFRMQLWDGKTGELLQTLEGEAEDVFVEYFNEGQVFRQFSGASFNADGRLMAAAGTGGVWLYEVQTGTLLNQFPGYYGPREVVFSPDSRWLMTCVFGPGRGTYCLPGIIDLQTAEEKSLQADEYAMVIEQFAFGPFQQWTAGIASSWNGPDQLILWETFTGAIYKTLAFPEEVELSSLALSPDGRLAAVGQETGVIQFVDLTSMKIVVSFTGHLGRIEHLAFSKDGTYLASGGYDGVVLIWGIP